ncbi:immunity 50 family protein [Streptomyces zaomyceticus]|uniref:Immunity 50 family protein n=1 Tax=Streptomyces zaomyceticus TaxID=68286 RepID=A0ABZ1L6H6_9ACTN|nr:immunity 50 family protein [Streptomyces zaomyceticus]
MSVSDWTDLLVDPSPIRDVFPSPPDLDECGLFFVHIDERGTGVTLGFDTDRVPDDLLHENGHTPANAFEFFVLFTAVTALRVEGWGGGANRSVRISRTAEGGEVAVSVESPTEHLAFHAREARVTRARGYLAGAP